MNVTVGFEIERFDFPRNIATILRKADFYGFQRDGSGPMEMKSPAFSMNTKNVPVTILLPTLLWKWNTEVMYRDESASTHYHIIANAFTYEEAQMALSLLPLFSPFFASSIENSMGGIQIFFTPNRKYWARYDISYEERRYTAITYNERGAKPPTWEFRICESSPIACHTAITIIYYAVKNKRFYSELNRISKEIEKEYDGIPGLDGDVILEYIYVNKTMKIISEMKSIIPTWILNVAKRVFNGVDVGDISPLLKDIVSIRRLTNIVMKYSANYCHRGGGYLELSHGFTVEVCKPVLKLDFGQEAPLFTKKIDMVPREELRTAIISIYEFI